MKISFVVAMSKNRVIGVKNQLPWRIRDDMKRFTELTTGHPVIMGRKTFESIPPKHRPLPDRTNIVLSRDATAKYEGAHTFATLGDAIRFASTSPGGEEIMIIGGGKVFEDALPLAHTIYLTEVDTLVENGDAFFPELDETRWQKTEDGRFDKNEYNEHAGTFYTYTRTNHYPIVEPANGRNEEYRSQLQRILESKQCPFCERGETLKEQKIIFESSTWFITPNRHPLPNTLHHFVITPKRHIEFFDELNDTEWQGLKECRVWLKEKYNFTGDAIYARSGEPLVTGASVAHFHAHLIVPAGNVQVSFGTFR